MITVTFSCGGCQEKVEGTTFLTREFISRVVGPLGRFGSYREPLVQDVIPIGWVAFDPYTQCTYCPECRKGIC